MKTKILPVLIALIASLAVGFFFWKNRTPSPSTSSPSSKQETAGPKTSPFNFSNPKKSAHYESNTPAHAATVAGIPINVVIDFNFDLAKPSEIKIMLAGKDYGDGETVIDESKLAMRHNMAPDSPDGLYTVEYKACWPDKTCHDGNFQFAIDRTRASELQDQTGKNEVEIKMTQIMFKPRLVKVSKGATVTWVNDDEEEHYVNTDSHPSHTYFEDQNSDALANGDVFGLTFNKPGIYPYHCSAHASNMVGTILVE